MELIHLDAFMTNSRLFPFNALPNPYYWAGNEHNLFSPFMFNFANRPDKTQEHVNWILKNKYSIESDGLAGNDDYVNISI